MAHDPGMADTLRRDLAGCPGLTERKMFGGLCFFTNGNMICGVGGSGSLFRCGKDHEAAALVLPGVSAMVMGGRRMGGFVRLSDTCFADDALRTALVTMARTHASGLPAKGDL